MKELSLVPQPTVHARRNKAITSSLDVAEYFGKRHTNVLRAINNLDCSEEFNRLNFASVKYVDAKGEKRTCYEMTKDGFTFLAMGFTGKQAALFKERYISAFNAMLKGLPDERKETITAKRLANRSLMDCVRLNLQRQGKEPKRYHYTTESNLCNWALRGAFSAIDEGTLPAWEAMALDKIRQYDELLLTEGVGYDARKLKLKAYADRVLPMFKSKDGGIAHDQ